MSRPWELPTGVEAIEGPRGVRLIGEADGLITALLDLQELCVPEGDITLGPWLLTSASEAPEDQDPHLIVYSADAWLLVPCVLIDVPTGGYHTPFDFEQVHYCRPPLRDIGVSLLGVPRYPEHLRKLNETPPPDSWPDARLRLKQHNLGAVLHVARHRRSKTDLEWEADLIDLKTGEITAESFATAPSLDELSDILLNGSLPPGRN